MPCLEELAIIFCRRLTVLPHRLLRKASSFQHLEILGSPLYNRYEDKEGSDRRSLSHIPSVEMGIRFNSIILGTEAHPVERRALRRRTALSLLVPAVSLDRK
ncbi:hypothetical protein BUALT_Bualt07G0166300 [Buddleja alternifolia]|uniref:Uncharacterized protein n=1 Tax=Buddleja alternifolia TaxID=168488 RepID=A0AAV6XI28_9LAMI|nr:hypothetical protein BUALT_Bualt07G0166300 [Buddleja alternifolia]